MVACHCTRVQGSGHRLAPSSVYVRRAAASRIKLPRVATCLGCAMELVYSVHEQITSVPQMGALGAPPL